MSLGPEREIEVTKAVMVYGLYLKNVYRQHLRAQRQTHRFEGDRDKTKEGAREISKLG